LHLHPVGETERYRSLDALRGLALFGVLLINLLGDFRVPLIQHMMEFHTDDGRLNHLVDILSAAFVEFKAFTLFSFLFGVGTAIQAERCAARGLPVFRFLLRRFAVLLAVGFCHIVVLWNGDILMLYAVCGFIMIGTLRLSTWTLAMLGLAAILLPNFVPLNRISLRDGLACAGRRSHQRVWIRQLPGDRRLPPQRNLAPDSAAPLERSAAHRGPDVLGRGRLA
jgi:uncharacterized protein